MTDHKETPSIFNQNLDPNIANHQPLTPLTFLDWSATAFYPDKTAVIPPLRRLYTAISSTPTGSSPGAADSSPLPSRSGV